MGFLDMFRPNKDAIYDKGVDALKRGDAPAAIKYFSKVVNLDPSDAPAHYHLATSYVAVKDYASAASHFREYIRLDPSGADLREYVDVLEKAALVDITEGEQILRDYLREQEQASSQATVAGKTVHADELLKTADKLLFTEGFSRRPVVRKFSKAMSAKIPLRFYGVKEFQRISPQDAFGFAIAFATSGYAVAKASKSLLGDSTYLAVLPTEVVQKLRSARYEEGIPIGYDKDLLRLANPIPWTLIDRVLGECIEINLANILKKLSWARSIAEATKEYLVKEFVLVGYYIGLWENVMEQNG